MLLNVLFNLVIPSAGWTKPKGSFWHIKHGVGMHFLNILPTQDHNK